MSDNPHGPPPSAAGDTIDTGYRILQLQGRDAWSFAQAQFMNDVLTLHDGQAQWNGWLNPKGRLIALFMLCRRDDTTAWLLLPDADPETLGDALGRYVFRSKVQLTPRDDLMVLGSQIAATPPDSNTDTPLTLPWPGHRHVHIHPSDATPDSEAADASLQWRAADLRAGIPRLEPGQSEQWTPQQLSLERLQAYSVKKGCYPGQEIVARTHFLGKAKRSLRLLEAEQPVPPGTELLDGGQAIGQTIASAGPLALAVAPPDAPAVSADGSAIRWLAFTD